MLSRLSLRYRIALVIFILEACMLAIVLSVTLQQSKQTASIFDKDSQQASFALLSNLSVTALLTGEYSDYQLYLDDIKRQPSIVHILLADRQDRVVASSEVSEVGLLRGNVLIQNLSGWQIEPVNSAAGPLGILAVQFSDSALSSAYRQTGNLAFFLAISGMVIIAMVGIATGFALTRRLAIVAHAARQFTEGDKSARSRVSGADEVSQLSRDVDLMADSMLDQEKKLREQGEYIALLLDSTAEAIYGVDTQGICTFVNSACIKMLGYSAESDLVGKEIHSLIHHSYADGTSYPFEACRVRLSTTSGLVSHAEDEVHWRADGTCFPVEYWSHPMYKEKILIGAVVTFIDITERKLTDNKIRQLNAELEKRVLQRTVQLESANRELESFSYSVSHDLRAPLRAIDGFSQALIEDYGHLLDATGKHYLERVRNGAQFMGELIDDLLKLARVSRAPLKPSTVDLSAIAHAIVAKFVEIEPERKVHIEISTGITVEGDFGLLNIALENLIGNAWKYTSKTINAKIEFAKKQNADETVYFVRDNGAGFDMKFADKLFGAFQRLHRYEDFEGTGIGLATVQRIIHRHDGRIWAEAKPGQGATFFFTLNVPSSVGN